jgi:hypothetical protein
MRERIAKYGNPFYLYSPIESAIINYNVIKNNNFFKRMRRRYYAAQDGRL